MRLYAQYYNWDLADKLQPALSTNRIYRIDGRFSLDSAIVVAKAHAQRLRKVHKFAGFTIHRGNLKQATCIHIELPTVVGKSVFKY